MESATGRPFFRGLPPTWQRLSEMIDAAAAQQPVAEATDRGNASETNFSADQGVRNSLLRFDMRRTTRQWFSFGEAPALIGPWTLLR